MLAKGVRRELLDYSTFANDGVAVIVPETHVVIDMNGFEHCIHPGVSFFCESSEPSGVPL